MVGRNYHCVPIDTIDYRTTFERGFLQFAQWVAGSLVSHVHHLRLVKL